jgi:glycosyltransferase involved in cell wall biosynthesis
MKNCKVSVVIPVFNAELTLENAVKIILLEAKLFASVCEIILVDDYSSDNSWEIIKRLSKNNKNILGIKMAKNYGVDKVITAGLKRSSGDYIYIISCDLQDPIDKMSEMFEKIINNKSVDIVCSFFINKHPESIASKFLSKLYWRLFSFFMESYYPEEEGLYRLLSRKAVNFYLHHTNDFKHVKILHDTGLKKEYIEMNQLLRDSGKSGYTFRKKIKFAIDYISSYSYVPLTYSAIISFGMSLMAFLFSLVFVVLKMMELVVLPGWTSLVAIITFFFSVLFFNLSIVAIYLSKNMERIKKSNSYFISEET